MAAADARRGPAGEEPFYRPPYHNLRHPLIFYYAHPAVLYVNKLRVAGVLADPLNAYFETIFETVRPGGATHNRTICALARRTGAPAHVFFTPSHAAQFAAPRALTR